MFSAVGTEFASASRYDSPPSSRGSMPRTFSSSATAMTSRGWRRLSSASIVSKISRCAGRKKSSTCSVVATSSKAAGLMNTAPSTDFSASRLCGCDRWAGVVLAEASSSMAPASYSSRRPPGDVDLAKKKRAPPRGCRALSKSSGSSGFGPKALFLFLDDPDLDGRVDAAAQLDLDLGEPERLDGLREVDLLGVDLDALLAERVGDVARRDRPVELVLLADRARDRDAHLRERVRLGLGLLGELGRARRDDALLVLDALDVGGRRLEGVAPRQEEVARVARLDVDDLARLAEVLHVVPENDLHDLRSRDREGHDGEHARAVHRHRDLALVLRAVAGKTARRQLAAVGDEVLEEAGVLVVDLERLVSAELALLAAPHRALLVAIAAAVALVVCWHSCC